jgi:hypothetical protein
MCTICSEIEGKEEKDEFILSVLDSIMCVLGLGIQDMLQ